MKEYQKQYQEEHKDKIRAKRYARVKCECGGHHTFQHTARHMKTTKHMAYIAEQE
jgi:hypothetical protein